MQIVIDISEDDLDAIKYLKAKGWASRHELLILNGTPLPKGHGRISDMDEAIKGIKEIEGEDAIWAISLIEWACDKRTIIEADKEESEVQE